MTGSGSELVARWLRQRIITGELAPEQPLVLRELAAQRGMSVIPIREALRILQAEGLVVTPWAATATVAATHRDDLRGIWRLRRCIEPELAAGACMLIADADLDTLAAGTAATLADESEDPRQRAQSCVDGYTRLLVGLLAPAASQWQLRILWMLWRAGQRYLCAGLDLADPAGRDASRLIAAGRGLIDGYRGAHPDQARGAMLRHLAWTHAVASRALDQHPGS